ncbi:MAG: hypothetical protein ACYCZL_02255 [Polaromonas sp.]
MLTSSERTAASLLPLLDDALADPAWRNRRVEVVLSQHFVRHVLTPAPCRVLSRPEERALVIASLREIYSDEIDQWKVQVFSQPPQYGLVGSAVDATFIQQLDALLARHGFREVTIRPLASVAARRLPNNFTGWWALVEPGWLSLFGLTNGAWQHLAGLPIDADWADALPDLIKHEAGLTILPPTSAVRIQAVGTGTVSKDLFAHEQWQLLPHDNQALGALALASV